ncbi:hypothetical protein WJX81_003132 [Elliptochloris bilobata]|uniref:Uncharacterized protein n=1 Tax=Elliptochloris bilobata TaxID=381761 RepID=A0AAW1S533_9CHLO
MQLTPDTLRDLCEALETYQAGPAAVSVLHLQYRGIESLQNLEEFTGVTSLLAVGNQISQVQGLHALSDLRHLDLAHNKLSVADGLQLLARLEVLDLAENAIRRVAALPSSLTQLSLSGNRLASAEALGGLRSCRSLAKLDLARNELRSVEALPAELEAPLRSLCLVGNPLIQALRESGVGYRRSVLARYEALEVLDAVHVGQAESVNATSAQLLAQADGGQHSPGQERAAGGQASCQQTTTPSGEGGADMMSVSEFDSDADLAERHAVVAEAAAAARRLGLVERQDSANYQPRPPAMTERQDSAQNLQAMAEAEAELAAAAAGAAGGSGAGPSSSAGPIGRLDSAHDMAHRSASPPAPRASSPPAGFAAGMRQQRSSAFSSPQRGVPLDMSLRQDSASDQPGPLPSSSAPQHPQGAGMDRVESLAEARRAVLPNLPVAREASQALPAEPLSRQDSALDSLVAARHAVLADLAQNPPAGASLGSADFLRRDSAGDDAAGAPRREAALLDPLLQARRLVLSSSEHASSSGLASPPPMPRAELGGYQADSPGAYAEHSALTVARRSVGLEVRASLGAANAYDARDPSCAAAPSAGVARENAGGPAPAALRHSGQWEALICYAAASSSAGPLSPSRMGQRAGRSPPGRWRGAMQPPPPVLAQAALLGPRAGAATPFSAPAQAPHPDSPLAVSGRGTPPAQMRRNRGSAGSLGASAELAEGLSVGGLAAGRSLSGYDSANEGDAA